MQSLCARQIQIKRSQVHFMSILLNYYLRQVSGIQSLGSHPHCRHVNECNVAELKTSKHATASLGTLVGMENPV